MGRSRRRNRATAPTSSSGQSSSASSRTPISSSTSVLASDSGVTETRRRTTEETALMEKNYRLAKELNDLRTRHRDETKNATRLTMQNMNLESRLRQAINHNDVLRKELVLHQKRTAELIASNQTEAHFGNSVFSHTLAGEDASEKAGSLSHPTLREIEKQTAQDHHTTDRETFEMPDKNENDVNLRDVNKIVLSERIGEGVNFDSLLEPPTHERRASLENYSPSPSAPLHVITGNTPDAAFGELNSTDFFQNSYKNTLPVTPEKDYGSPSKEKKIHSKLEKLVGNATEVVDGDNIDAFEASFSTTFPSSFKTTASQHGFPRSEPTNSGEDPFFPETLGVWSDKEKINRRRSVEYIKTTQVKTFPPSPRFKLQSKNRKVFAADRKARQSMKRTDSSGSVSNRSKEAKALNLFPMSPMNSFEALPATPPKRPQFKENEDVFKNPPPPPSEKSGVVAARARYDAAYKDKPKVTPKSNRYDVAYSDKKEVTSKSSKLEGDDSEHSPTLVLKRLHQRKAKEKISSTSSAVVATSDTVSRTTSDNVRVASTIVKNSNIGDPPPPPPPPPPPVEQSLITNRRSVRQPISYVEPSLNTKLRRGDVFFAKQEVSLNDSISVHNGPTQ